MDPLSGGSNPVLPSRRHGRCRRAHVAGNGCACGDAALSRQVEMVVLHLATSLSPPPGRRARAPR
jgi:hypothetical protein